MSDSSNATIETENSKTVGFVEGNNGDVYLLTATWYTDGDTEAAFDVVLSEDEAEALFESMVTVLRSTDTDTAPSGGDDE